MNDRHARIVAEIFSHPLPHNLEWREVVSVINELGTALQRHDGKYEFQVGRAKAVFTKPHDKDMEPAGIAELRRFLLEAWSNTGPSTPAATVVFIDHHGARIFAPGSSDGPAVHIEPYDPHGFRRHLEHKKEADYRGQRVPEFDEFYERVTQQLRSTPAIVLIGEGTGKSSAMHFLLEYLNEKHPEIARHVLAEGA